MPQVTVYIRKEDLALWEAVEQKSEFIHNSLHSIHSVEGIVEAVQEMAQRPDANTYEEDYPDLDTQSTKGEKPCCVKPKPCDHWQWDEDNQAWKNTLSNRTRTAQ